MRIDVEHIAHLARLALSAEEAEKFGRQLGSILAYVEKLGELDTTDIKPTSHTLPIENVMREDAARDSLSKDAALANAPDRADNFYRVPRIIE